MARLLIFIDASFPTLFVEDAEPALKAQLRTAGTSPLTALPTSKPPVRSAKPTSPSSALGSASRRPRRTQGSGPRHKGGVRRLQPQLHTSSVQLPSARHPSRSECKRN